MKVNLAGTIDNAGLNHQKSPETVWVRETKAAHNTIDYTKIRNMKRTQNFKLLGVVVE